MSDPRCSINFQENLKVSDNSVPNSKICLSHLTHQVSFSKSKIATSIVLEDVKFKQLLCPIFIFFENPLSSYLPFRTTVPCIWAEVSWICELATLSEQLVYLENVQNQMKYEKRKNYFAQWCSIYWLNIFLITIILTFITSSERILHNIKHCPNKSHAKLWNNLLTYTIEILYLLNPENFQFSEHYNLDQTTKEQLIHTYIKITQC